MSRSKTSSELKTQILQNINLCSQIHKTHKKNILDKLIVLNQDLAPQGSPEWLAIRVYNIGGSEMSTITGENCFSSIDKLVAQKIGFSHFSGNIATRWGKLFEFATQQITEIVFDIDDGIQETGSLEGAIPNQRYSPDGLAIIKMKCEDVVNKQKWIRNFWFNQLWVALRKPPAERKMQAILGKIKNNVWVSWTQLSVYSCMSQSPIEIQGLVGTRKHITTITVTLYRQ